MQSASGVVPWFCGRDKARGGELTQWEVRRASANLAAAGRSPSFGTFEKFDLGSARTRVRHQDEYITPVP